MKWKIHKLRYELLHMYAAEKYVFYFYHLIHFIKFTIIPCLRFQRVAKPVVSCLQMSKKFNYGIYNFGEKKTLVTWPQWNGTEEFNLNDGNHIVWMTILCWTRCQMGLPTAQILKQSDTIFKRLLGNSLETCNLGEDKNYTVTSTYL